ncbi:aifB [Symbiodinium necroappetens]|uniref:AifB protein n=1 Tax=Symbiodinium necroappetens TaxID=1628268 RepID=A0A812P8L6_9DINO|nr:aifB [Symbiodinium necroappetens]
MHHFARSLVPAGVRHLLPRAPKRVVIVGGGPTGLFCADRLRHHFQVTVVDSKEFFEFTPSILRALADPPHLSRITFDYREVLEGQLGVEFVLGQATKIDVPSRFAGSGGSASGSGTIATNGRGSLTVEPTVGSVREETRMSFDYCVVAVGVANGLWKPRSLEDLSGPTAASSSSTISTARPTNHKPAQPAVPVPSPGGSALDERRLDGRRRNLQLLHEKLANAPGAVVVGAGLVGVELAAELAHFFPRLKVTLVDGAAHVLPQLADPARDYTMEFFAKHGVKLRLGQPFVPELVSEGEVVLWCVGTKPRASELFVDRSVLRSNGQIRVNKRMQVLGSSHMGLTSVEELNHGVVLQPLGQGQIFAIGDAASVEGVPLAQMIFHGEEMASIAVANIEAAENVASPIALGGAKKEAEVGQPLLACTSLGPQDGMFSTQSELVATGALAAIQKQVIEATKMGALQGDPLSSLLWLPVH